jgi:multiple sugar transport system substrate-binding protein
LLSYPKDVIIEFLEIIAEKLVRNKNIERSIHRSEARRCASDVIEKFNKKDNITEKYQEDPFLFLDQIEVHTALIHSDGPTEMMKFYHEMIQDYFLASIYEKKFESSFPIIARNISQENWKYVIILSASIRDDSLRILNEIYKCDMQKSEKSKLIGLYLKERPKIDHENFTNEEIIKMMVELSLDDDYQSSWGFIIEKFFGTMEEREHLNFFKEMVIAKIRPFLADKDKAFSEATKILRLINEGVLNKWSQDLKQKKDLLKVMDKILNLISERPELEGFKKESSRIKELLLIDISIEAHKEHLSSPEYFKRSFKEILKKEESFVLNIIGEKASPLQSIEELKKLFHKTAGVDVEIIRYDLNTNQCLSKDANEAAPRRINIYEGDSKYVIEHVIQDYENKTHKYDLIFQPHIMLGKLVSENIIRPLETIRTQLKYENTSLNPKKDFRSYEYTSMYGGLEYGYPFTAQSMYLWYRKDLLTSTKRMDFKKKYGYELPDLHSGGLLKWEDYRNLAEFYTRQKGQKLYGETLKDDFYGTAIQAKIDHPSIWYEWLQIARSYGGGVLKSIYGSEYGDIIVNTKETIKATEFYKSLREFSPREALGWDWYDVADAFKSGRIFMALLWNDQTYDALRDKGDEFIGFTLPPVIEETVTHIESWNCFIPIYTDNPKLAYLFMEWLMDEEVQLEYQKRGGASARFSIYEESQKGKFEKLTYMKTSRQAFQYGFPSLIIPEAYEVQRETIKGLNKIIQGNENIKTVFDKVASDLHFGILKGKSQIHKEKK